MHPTHATLETIRVILAAGYVCLPLALYALGSLLSRLFAFDAADAVREMDEESAIVAIRTAQDLFASADKCERAARAWEARGMRAVYAPHLAVALRRQAVLTLAIACSAYVVAS